MAVSKIVKIWPHRGVFGDDYHIRIHWFYGWGPKYVFAVVGDAGDVGGFWRCGICAAIYFPHAVRRPS